MLRRKKSKAVEMHELAKIVREFTFMPDRKIPLLISFDKLEKSDLSALTDAKVNVCEVMPELNIVYAEIMPKNSILDKLNEMKSIKRISIPREVEVYDYRQS